MSHIPVFSINLSRLSKNLLSYHCEEYSRLAPKTHITIQNKNIFIWNFKTHKNKKVHESVTEYLGGKIEHSTRQNQEVYLWSVNRQTLTCQCRISQLDSRNQAILHIKQGIVLVRLIGTGPSIKTPKHFTAENTARFINTWEKCSIFKSTLCDILYTAVLSHRRDSICDNDRLTVHFSCQINKYVDSLNYFIILPEYYLHCTWLISFFLSFVLNSHLV